MYLVISENKMFGYVDGGNVHQGPLEQSAPQQSQGGRNDQN